MSYSLDFRLKVLAVKEKRSLSIRETGALFKLSPNTVFLWMKPIAPRLKRQKPPTKISMTHLKQDVEAFPDAYGYERAKRLGVRACFHEFILTL